MKRHLLIPVATLAVICMLFVVFVPSSVHAATSCSTQASRYSAAVTIPLTVNAGTTITASSSQGPITITFPNGSTAGPGYPSESGTATTSGTATVSFGAPLGVAFYTITVCPAGSTTSNQPTCPIFLDGRLNDCIPWETSAVYCLGDGSVRIYVPAQPLWRIAFDTSPAEIAKVSKKPDRNTLIKSGRGARLYRLTDGPLQVNTPGLDPTKGDYVFRFQDCPVP